MSTSDELKLVLDSAREILLREEPDGGSDESSVRTWQLLAAAGLTSMALSESAGGGDWLAGAAAVARLCAEHAVAVPFGDTALVAGPLLTAAGLPLPTGIVTAADSGRAEARRDGDRLQVDLELTAVPWAALAERLVAVVDASGEEVLVSLDPSLGRLTPGRNFAGEPRDGFQMRAEVTPDSWAVVPAGTARELRQRGALARSLAIAGAGAAVLRRTVTYAGEREQFGRPIARFQAVQHAVAELAAEVEATGAAVDAAVAACTQSGAGSARAGVAVAVAKVQAGVGAAAIARLAHQVHGAIGTTREHPLHRWTTGLWAWRDEFGSEHSWERALATTALALDPWEVVTA